MSINRALRILRNSHDIKADQTCIDSMTALFSGKVTDIIQAIDAMIQHSEKSDYNQWNETSIGNAIFIIQVSRSKKLTTFFLQKLAEYCQHIITTKRCLFTETQSLRDVYKILLT